MILRWRCLTGVVWVATKKKIALGSRKACKNYNELLMLLQVVFKVVFSAIFVLLKYRLVLFYYDSSFVRK